MEKIVAPCYYREAPNYNTSYFETKKTAVFNQEK
jgi:hypothetical protein